jgi:hypothetical protein
MTPAQAIAPQVLKSVSDDLVASPQFCERLEWWLQGGHSSEKWVQFEWAFRLQAKVKPQFAVLCEHDQLKDITLVPANTEISPLFNAAPVAGIELKWWGNWWVDNIAVKNLECDLQKVDGYELPAAALLLFLRVKPAASALHHRWIHEQVHNVNTFEALQGGLLSTLSKKADFAAVAKIEGGPELEEASLHTLVFYNHHARVGFEVRAAT